ncbi:MAG: hypothetical protein ABH842_06025 [Candidatus Micrarchaeota archaeon]
MVRKQKTSTCRPSTNEITRPNFRSAATDPYDHLIGKRPHEKGEEKTRETSLLPERANIAGSFVSQLTRLEAANYGNGNKIAEETMLYRTHAEMKGKIEKDDLPTKCRLLLLLHPTGIDPNSAIENLRRQVIFSLLEDFLDETVVTKAIRTEHIRKQFTFTFALNTDFDGRQTIKLSDATCDLLRSIDATNQMAHTRLREFLDTLPDEVRSKIDLGTAQYIDHGKKRYAYRVQYDGKNAVMLIGMEDARGGNAAAFLTIMKKEAELYEIARNQPRKVLHIPDVFAVFGGVEDAGIVMTDITKGGNARLLCIQCNVRLIPPELHGEYQDDIQLLNKIMAEHGVKAFDIRAEGSIYIQTSLKDGSKRVYALDFENLV